MGTCSSSSASSFADKFATVRELDEALRSCGLENGDMIIAVDNTGSNDIKGPGGSGLHDVDPSDPFPTTPYEFVLQGLGRRVLSALDKDAVVPMYGFGDSVCSSHPSGCRLLGMAHGMDDARAIYRDYVTDTRIGRSGPTSFAGVISQAMDRVRETGRYHTLIIISDGAVDDEPEAGGESLTAAAIVEAANLPLAIITVGVGVGPWDVMVRYDDGLARRRCDNFQFAQAPASREALGDVAAMERFELEALQEIPQHLQWLRAHGMFSSPAARTRAPLPTPVAAKDYGAFA